MTTRATTTTTYVVRLTCFVAILLTASASSKCRFPQEWRGEYYQSGLGEIVVRDNAITTKGNCVQQIDDKYLLDNRENNCSYCLLIMSHHRNMLQYKESHCTTQSDFWIVCSQIKVETPLYTLIRESATPIACPFTDFYNFDYDDLTQGFCGKRDSVASPCSSASKYRLKFKHCQRQALFHGKEIEMECLATWKDGSETFLYARLISDEIVQEDEKYRCLKYHHYGNDVTLSMSVDATCRGLRSSTDGPFLMEFNKVELSNEQSAATPCRFPDWFRNVTWRDLTGQLKYHADDSLVTLVQETRRSRGQTKEHFHTIHRCRGLLTKTPNEGSETYVFHTYSSQDCDSHHLCLRLHKTKNDILAISEGEIDDSSDPMQACVVNSTYTKNQYFMPAHNMEVKCPRPGILHTHPNPSCMYRLTVGCSSPSYISIDHGCTSGSGVGMECLASWNDASSARSYVMVRYRNENTITCYSFRRENDSDVFGYDIQCPYNHQTPPAPPPPSVSPSALAQKSLVYTIQRHDTCQIRGTHHLPKTHRLPPPLVVTKRPQEPHHRRTHPTYSAPFTSPPSPHKRKHSPLSGQHHHTKHPSYPQRSVASSAIPLGTVTSFYSFSKEDREQSAGSSSNNNQPHRGSHRDVHVANGGDDSKLRDHFGDDDYEDEDGENDGDGDGFGSGAVFDTTQGGKKRGTDSTAQDRSGISYKSNVKYDTHQEDIYDKDVFHNQWPNRKKYNNNHQQRQQNHNFQPSTSLSPHGVYPTPRLKSTAVLPDNNHGPTMGQHQFNPYINNNKQGKGEVLDGGQFKVSSSSSSSSSSSPSSSSSSIASLLSAILATPQFRQLKKSRCSLASYLSLPFLNDYLKPPSLSRLGLVQDGILRGKVSRDASSSSKEHPQAIVDHSSISSRVLFRDTTTAGFPVVSTHSFEAISSRDSIVVEEGRAESEKMQDDDINVDILQACNLPYFFHFVLRQMLSMNFLLALFTFAFLLYSAVKST